MHTHLLPSGSVSSSSGRTLLDTIVIPRELSDLERVLPARQYDDSEARDRFVSAPMLMASVGVMGKAGASGR
jgi:hypothetical protein